MPAQRQFILQFGLVGVNAEEIAGAHPQGGRANVTTCNTAPLCPKKINLLPKSCRWALAIRLGM